jgi:light-regulated signal transduction histidine kinase (bacteriophytochrome)
VEITDNVTTGGLDNTEGAPMSGSLVVNTNHTVDLMKMVRSSLETIRNMLEGGTPTEETKAQIQQLEQLEQLLLDQAARLDSINKVLEEFNYSVAHELFAPLRRISGFAREIRQRFNEDIDLEGLTCLDSILESSQQMNELIDALMQLSRFSHAELQQETVDLSEIASGIVDELSLSAPQRSAAFTIRPQLRVQADACLLKTALRKLFDNAWKYTSQKENTRIEFGALDLDTGQVFFVKDNGVGFDMADYGKLFHPFQRLHDSAVFPGNGIGLTAVKRIINRHGGQIWAEAVRDQGATFFFTLP